MRQIPEYIAKKTFDALLLAQSECEYHETFKEMKDDPNSACAVRRPDNGTPGCHTCELVAYWQENA